MAAQEVSLSTSDHAALAEGFRPLSAVNAGLPDRLIRYSGGQRVISSNRTSNRSRIATYSGEAASARSDGPSGRIRCQEPMSGATMQENDFSVPDTFVIEHIT